MKGEGDAAELAVLFAVAVAGIDDIVHILRVQRDETKTVGYELVRQHRCVRLYLYQVYCHRRDLREDSSA
jgi:hypothetical protein